MLKKDPLQVKDVNLHRKKLKNTHKQISSWYGNIIVLASKIYKQVLFIRRKPQPFLVHVGPMFAY